MIYNMMQDILDSIPEDIIREHIIPYTYEPQPKTLCDDVRNYYDVLNELKAMYATIYSNGYDNEDNDWLSNDIERFMNEDFPTMFGYRDFFLQFYRRMFLLQHANENKIISLLSTESIRMSTNVPRQIALMTPSEREDLKTFLIEINQD